MSIPTNQLQQLTSILGTDSVLLDSAAGTGRFSLDDLGRYIAEKENLRYGVNLLDNWYFPDPINQRGQTEYAGSGYTIDRWFSQGNINVEKKNNMIVLVPVNKSMVGFVQKVEKTKLTNNLQYTASILTANNELLSLSFIWNLQINHNFGAIGSSTPGQYLELTNDGNGDLNFLIVNNVGSGGANFNIVAAKLELGPVQTLAHQDASGNWVLNDPPPNKALELLKCQRYLMPLSGLFYYVGWFNEPLNGLHIPYPPMNRMREGVNPTIIFGGGKTFADFSKHLTIDCGGQRIISSASDWTAIVINRAQQTISLYISDTGKTTFAGFKSTVTSIWYNTTAISPFLSSEP